MLWNEICGYFVEMAARSRNSDRYPPVLVTLRNTFCPCPSRYYAVLCVFVTDEEWAKIALSQSKGPTPECGKGKVAQVVSEVATECGLSKRQARHYSGRSINSTPYSIWMGAKLLVAFSFALLEHKQTKVRERVPSESAFLLFFLVAGCMLRFPISKGYVLQRGSNVTMTNARKRRTTC